MVRIWDPGTGGELARLDTGHPGGLGQLHIAPDGSWLAAVGAASIAVSHNTSHELAVMRLGGTARCCLLRNDSRGIFVGGSGGLYGLEIVLD